MSALKAWLLGFALVGCGGAYIPPPPPAADAGDDAYTDTDAYADTGADVVDDVCHPARDICGDL